MSSLEDWGGAGGADQGPSALGWRQPIPDSFDLLDMAIGMEAEEIEALPRVKRTAQKVGEDHRFQVEPFEDERQTVKHELACGKVDRPEFERAADVWRCHRWRRFAGLPGAFHDLLDCESSIRVLIRWEERRAGAKAESGLPDLRNTADLSQDDVFHVFDNGPLIRRGPVARLVFRQPGNGGEHPTPRICDVADECGDVRWHDGPIMARDGWPCDAK